MGGSLDRVVRYTGNYVKKVKMKEIEIMKLK